MIVKAWNDAIVFYQASADDDWPKAAIIVRRDNGGALVTAQEDSEIVVNLHRDNIKEFCKALQDAVGAAQQVALADAKKKK